MLPAPQAGLPSQTSKIGLAAPIRAGTVISPPTNTPPPMTTPAARPSISDTPAIGRDTGISPGTIAIVLMTVVAWASAFPGIRAGLTTFGPVELGAARFAVAALPAAIVLAWRRPAPPALHEIWRVLAGGLLFVALYTVLLNMGERTVSAGAASFIININPVFTAALAIPLLGERFGVRAWAGTALSFCGIGLIALGESGGPRIDHGALLVLGAAVCNAVTTVVQKPLFSRHHPLTISCINMVVGALLLSPALPSALSQGRDALATGHTGGVWAALYLGLVPGLLAYGSWTVVLSRLPAARAANFLYCVPPVATLMGFVWLGERPTTLGVLGGAMALGGVMLVNLRRR